MRYLGVDYGTKRIGIAISEPIGGIVSPVKMIDSVGDLARDAVAIVEAADEYAADAIVVGLPLNMDGTEGPQAKMSHTLADEIRKAGGDAIKAVHLHDERLTSDAASRRLLDRDLTRKQKKARRDAVAAQILLESFLECSR